MKHLLAPVPAVILPSAVETHENAGRVAFGSNAFDVLSKLRDQEVTVWIVATAADAPAGGVAGFPVGKVVLKGRLAGIVDGDRRGLHPDPALRPAATLNDAEWHYGLFWEVAEMQRLVPSRAVAGLVSAQGVKLVRPPHGPLPIRDPDSAP